MLRDKADGFDQSRSHDEGLSSWLRLTTINLLYALSARLGEGVGLVRLKRSNVVNLRLIIFDDILARKSDFCQCMVPPLAEHLLWFFRGGIFLKAPSARP